MLGEVIGEVLLVGVHAGPLFGVVWVSIGLSEVRSGLLLGRLGPAWCRDTARALLRRGMWVHASMLCVCVSKS